MQLDIHTADDLSRVHIRGDLDTNTSREALERLEPLVAPGARFILDLSGVDYMSSAGLRFTLSLYRRVDAADGRLCFAGLQPSVRDTMDVTGFLEFFEVHDTVEAALDAMRSESP